MDTIPIIIEGAKDYRNIRLYSTDGGKKTPVDLSQKDMHDGYQLFALPGWDVWVGFSVSRRMGRSMGLGFRGRIANPPQQSSPVRGDFKSVPIKRPRLGRDFKSAPTGADDVKKGEDLLHPLLSARCLACVRLVLAYPPMAGAFPSLSCSELRRFWRLPEQIPSGSSADFSARGVGFAD